MCGEVTSSRIRTPFGLGSRTSPVTGSLVAKLRSWNNTAGDHQRLHVEVSDTGVGFDPAEAPRLFEAFEQGPQAPERSGGLGLGLAICRGVMELHGGGVAATSRGPGLGARFVIEIDTVEGAPAPPPEAVAMLDPAMPASRLRLLLVEDHQDTADLLRELLGDAGYEVSVAGSAQAALAVDLDHFDLVISDIGLPGTSGLDLMRSIRSAYPLKDVALSGYGTEADILASKEAGFSAHLTSRSTSSACWPPSDRSRLPRRCTDPAANEDFLPSVGRRPPRGEPRTSFPYGSTRTTLRTSLLHLRPPLG